METVQASNERSINSIHQTLIVYCCIINMLIVIAFYAFTFFRAELDLG